MPVAWAVPRPRTGSGGRGQEPALKIGLGTAVVAWVTSGCSAASAPGALWKTGTGTWCASRWAVFSFKGDFLQRCPERAVSDDDTPIGASSAGISTLDRSQHEQRRDDDHPSV
jgi:hypothetical protein